MHDLTKPTYETLVGQDGVPLIICDATLTVNGRKIICSGGGKNRLVAHAKMISEAAERIVYFSGQGRHEAPMSSTGFAAHTNRADAQLAAQNELIERSFIDQIRRNPQSVNLEQSSEECWTYRISEHNCWACIARANTPETSGWGASVNTSAHSAKQAALMEGFMMASSHATYGRRGNAITAFPGGADKLGSKILTRHFSSVRVSNETRFVCLAYWEIP